MGQRVKGQEVEISVTVDGAVQETLNLARSIELEWKTETLQEGYMGETTDRYDTIYKGLSGKIEFHFDTAAPFNMIQKIVNKARRREPGTRINIKATVNFPGGERAKILVKDAEFGPLPINFGSRADYGTFSLSFAASDGQMLPV